jgi:dolichyl-phosphate-mannose-protein mannosyltransferase
MSYSTGNSANVYSSRNASLSHRGINGHLPQNPENVDDGLQEIISKTSSLNINANSKFSSHYSTIFIKYINPIVLTALSAAIRLYRINVAPKVLWDEAHFGKFGSYYLKHEFYFDVHPPLGKLLVGLSGYLANYDGNFAFESGNSYTSDVNYVLMRCFNCLFGILCTPLAYKTAVALNYSQWTVWYISLLVVFEMLSLTLSKFILLDSMLLFFTVLCFYCLVKIHNLRIQNKLLSLKGLKWLFFTGFAVGCVCSVKWVGLFITAIVGFYTIYDLSVKTYQLISPNPQRVLFRTYISHWISRIITLILIPFIIYSACFRIHFAILSKSGPGDGSISTLMQASLEGNTIPNGPRSVAFGSLVTLRSQGLSPNLLHSHSHNYLLGSQQQQVTTYGFKDENNEFLVEFDCDSAARGEFATLEPLENDTYSLTKVVKDGDSLRLVHKSTGCLLRTHAIPAAVSKNFYEVSCFSDLENSDVKDEWIVNIQRQGVSPSPEFEEEPANEVHPISTNFRLQHKTLGCYLATTGYAYPSWGFQQGEVVCKYPILAKDKSTWWNVEDHRNDKLASPTSEYVAPKPIFWKEFILLNYAMMASNNALIPDPDKFDKLSSEWWEWPILHSGLRMGSWSVDDVKFFLMGHPFITWFSSLSLVVFFFYSLIQAYKWQRQKINYGLFDSKWNSFLIQGIIPFACWFFHYYPFIVMGRVKYLHHYVPALYFAIFVSGFVMESLIEKKAQRHLKYVIYVTSYLAILAVFWKYRQLAFGMDGSAKNYYHLRLLSSWML